MSRLRGVAGVVVTVLSALLVWTALVLPGRLDRLGPGPWSGSRSRRC